MKKIYILILVLVVGAIGIISGCDSKEPNFQQLEQQRINLYLEVMKSVFQVENGGDEFIAIKLDTLEGLSAEGKDMILDRFKDISLNVYYFEDIKNDESKFKYDGKDLLGTINGSLLWIELEEYEENSTKIIGTSWFGNLGSISIEYDATFKNGEWKLTELSNNIS